MAMFGDDQGRTERPTPNRLNEVRARGDTNLSREFMMAGTMLCAVVALRWFGRWLIDALGLCLSRGLTVDLAAHPVADASISGATHEILQSLALVALPILLLLCTLVLAVIVFGYGQIGVRWSDQVLGFKLDRINPARNWTRIFNVQALVRAGFAAVKLGVLVAVLWLVLHSRWLQLAQLHEMEFAPAVAMVADMALDVFLWVAVVVLVIAAADVAWQRFDFQQRNMMTRQETEDERKRSEGDPIVKNRQRQARFELFKHRMMEAVPKADVVITNPTHFSVALRYDRKKHAAPEVVAKGADDIALRIRELARAAGVPLMADPPLARALYRAVKIGQQVPEKFYQAVATVLSHVYRLKGRVA